jgi:hypothetical protein
MMPGQEFMVTRDRVAGAVMPNGPEPSASDGVIASGDPAGGGARPGPGPLMARMDRPIVPGLISLLAALAFVLARWQTWAKGNIGRSILVGRHFATQSQLPHGIPVAPTYGYDGQFFYRLALNPVNFSHIAYGIRVDKPYRYMRIGYPWLTWLVSFGQHVLVPVMLVVINIAAIGAMGYLGAMFARRGGRHALAGLVLPAYFGLITSLSRDTAEPLAAACLLAGLLAIRARRPLRAGLILAYGALTRETVMVVVAALAIVRVIGVIRRPRSVRPGYDDLAWAIPAAAFAAWQVVVKVAVGSFPLLVDGGDNTGSPFITPIKAVEHNLTYVNLHHFEQYDLWFAELGILILFAVAALLSLRSTNAPVHERLAFVLYLIQICAVSASTWYSLDADLRSFIDVYLMAAIILLGTPRRRAGSRLLPALEILLVPVLIVVTQRRLAGS